MTKSKTSQILTGVIVAFLVVTVAAIASPHYEPPCNGDLDQVFDPCGSGCERSCDNINDPSWNCTPKCIEGGGCRCAKGLVRNYGWICVLPEDCARECPEGEAYSRCGRNEFQNTCKAPEKMTTCSASTGTCISGCVCVLAYVRDDNGICIPVENCGVSCGGDVNAVKTLCANDCSRRTCATLNDEPFFCSTECTGIEECICKSGYVMHDGKCTPISECPICPGPNESYLSRPCDLDCGNLTEKCDSKDSCTLGCFCNLGFARDHRGVCVRLDKCAQKECNGDPNAIFDQCDAHCPKTCEYKDGDPNCIRGCRRQGGCVCREGFVLNSKGKCIAPEECNLLPRSTLRTNDIMCPTHEMHCDCANCAKSCSVTEVDPNCVCKPGCACEAGLLRNSAGVCVPSTQCDPPCNGDLDKYFNPAGDSCARTCENINDPKWSCTPNATDVGVCMCKEGLVRNYGGRCVLPEDCNKECPEQEVYSQCGRNKCQDTCAEPNKKMSCVDKCRPGCVCEEGWIRDSNGICTLPGLCDMKCGGDGNAFTTKCANPCNRRTCTTVNDEPFFCTSECDGVEACICKPGYVMQDGKCIPIKNCPTCPGINESYLNRPCDLNCTKLEDKCEASRSGKEGCFCNIGYARDYKGVCVRLTECAQKSCDGDNRAIYDQCNAHCPKTCEKLNGDPDCIPGCRRDGGCVCREGFVKNAQGQCVAPEECSLQQRALKKFKNAARCPENEVRSPCANCQKSCSVREVDAKCKCQSGCACADGYLRNSKGTCVPKDKCDSPCGDDNDKIFDPFGDSCQRTCENINDKNWTCTPQSSENGACKCVEGLVRNSAGYCVNPKDCSQKCPEGEAYSQSGNHNCQNTCDNPKKSSNCFPLFKAGCVCINGYMRDSSGVCIPSGYCGQSCKGDNNAISTTCATPCSYRTCASINEEPRFCPAVCNGIETCICKPGYVTSDDKCVPASSCQKCEGANESYLSRSVDLNCYSLEEKCDISESGKDGCYCNIGYARDHRNNCIRLNKCPQKSCNGDANAIFEQCGVNCQRTCAQKDGDPNCVPECKRPGECVCRDGFVKSSEGKCIPPQECCLTPKSQLIPSQRPSSFPDPKFNVKKSLTPSNTLAPCQITTTTTTTTTPKPTTTTTPKPTMKTTPKPVTTTTPEPTTTTTQKPTTCKPRKPKQVRASDCGQNEIFEHCPMKCVPPVTTCEMHFKGERPECTMDFQNCKPECRCMAGFVTTKSGKCIMPQDCCEDPNSQFIAGPNRCPGGTCRQPQFSQCSAEWQPFGCQCKMGFLKKSDRDDTCVSESECYKYKKCDD
ncbi:zonadhesin-like [Arctopsyche grandis]|uniref:zonadhesin-like n=1 Tax=Arctopsyche grandis TaxID=121162 RepID=UPI00406D9F5D